MNKQEALASAKQKALALIEHDEDEYEAALEFIYKLLGEHRETRTMTKRVIIPMLISFGELNHHELAQEYIEDIDK